MYSEASRARAREINRRLAAEALRFGKQYAAAMAASHVALAKDLKHWKLAKETPK